MTPAADRKRSTRLPEQQLHQRELLVQALSAASDGIIITDPTQPDNPIVYVSPGFERITGYASEEVLGRNCRFLQGFENDQPVLEKLRAAVREEREFRDTLLNYRKDGTLFWNELSISPVYDEEGRLINFVGVQNDVTDQVEAEEELRKTSRDLTTIFESITDALFTLDNEWRFTYLNSEAERVLDRKKDALLGKGIWEEFPEAVGLTFYREYNRAVDEQRTVEFEEYYPPLETWFEVKAYPSEAGLSVYFRDVNQQKQAEQDLKRNEEWLRAVLVQYASDIITIVDAEGIIVFESPAVERLLGHKPEDMVETNVFDYIHPDDRERTTRQFTEFLNTQETSNPEEFRFRHADGSWRYLEVVGNNLLDDPGVRGIVINSRDVTERKKEEEIRRRQARVAELRAEVSATLAKGGTLQDTLQHSTEAMVRHLDVALIRVWTFNGDEDVLELSISKI